MPSGARYALFVRGGRGSSTYPWSSSWAKCDNIAVSEESFFRQPQASAYSCTAVQISQIFGWSFLLAFSGEMCAGCARQQAVHPVCKQF
eukprot:SAG25_NODE_90_length_16264_cov_230.399876_4_plen_89_part_00